MDPRPSLHPSNEPKQHRLLHEVHSGRFRDALGLLHCNPQLRKDPANLALLAELQMRTGNLDGARSGAQRLLQQRHTEPTSRIKCHFVLGTISRDSGQLDQARIHYSQAIELATNGHDLGTLCTAQILLLSLHVAGSNVEAAAILPALRRNVRASGDTFVTIAFHIFLSEMESRRGYFVVARQQLAAARSLLQDAPNVFLEGNAAVAEMCLSLLCAEYEAAIRNGHLALKCADESGNYRTALAARLNLGQVLLNQGRIAEAEEHLQQALGVCPKGGNNEIGVLDALAQVFLARGDVQMCEAFLARIDDVLAKHDLPVAYNRYWGMRTRLLLLGRLGRWSDAQRLVENIGVAIPVPTDSSLTTYLTLARAEILLASGKIEESNGILLEVSSTADSLSLENQAHLERLLALHATRACPVAAPLYFERAIRILQSTGNRRSYLDVLDEYRLFLLSGSLSDSVKMETTVERRRNTKCEDVLNRVAALHRFSDHPLLLGLEAFWLLAETGCASVVGISKGDEIRRTLLFSSNRSTSHESTCNKPVVSIPLDRDNAWKLFVVPLQEGRCLASCETVARLVNVSLTTGISRQELRECDGLTSAADGTEGAPDTFLSISLKRMVQASRGVVSSAIPVLVTGETGTGKEVLARFIHDQSARSAKPFVAFNCSTVPHELLDSQLFGYRRGAFTGAYEHFEGLVRAADGGTLFLDEIGDLDRKSQPKLLRFLESGEVHPLGESRPVRANVRIIAATNVDLDRLVSEGHFREDLFYRLNVIRYHIPPLRERRDEIPALVDCFLKKFSEEFHKNCLRVATETLDCLLLFSWPGNVRQLANEIRRAVALTDGLILLPDRLSPAILGARTGARPIQTSLAGVFVNLDQPLSGAADQLERAMLEHALDVTHGRIEPAARLLGLSRKGFFLKRHRLGVRPSKTTANSR